MPSGVVAPEGSVANVVAGLRVQALAGDTSASASSAVETRRRVVFIEGSSRGAATPVTGGSSGNAARVILQRFVSRARKRTRTGRKKAWVLSPAVLRLRIPYR